MAADDKKQILAETQQSGGEVESNEQNHATSQETQLDAAESQMLESRPTQKEAGELNAEITNIQILRKEGAHRGPTGPRTEIGKQRSSKNAIKFGIFSKATLLKGESASQYRELLEGLWKTWQPVGKAEELDVEKLASISWRQCRTIIAESAEIRKNSEFLEFDRRLMQHHEADVLSQKREAGADVFTQVPVPLISNIRNPNVLKRCVELLVELRQRIKDNGLNCDEDSAIIKTIYGDTAQAFLRPSLYDEFMTYLGTAKATESERKRKGYATPEECKQRMVRCIGLEIRRLKEYLKKRESIESERTKVEILRQSVPESRRMDGLVSYAVHLRREYAETVAELERKQRMRKGQSGPPTLKIEVS